MQRGNVATGPRAHRVMAQVKAAGAFLAFVVLSGCMGEAKIQTQPGPQGGHVPSGSSFSFELVTNVAAVSQNQTFTVEARITNAGQQSLSTLTVGAVSSSGTGKAILVAQEPLPAGALAPGATAVLRSTYQAIDSGTLDFEATASALDASGATVGPLTATARVLIQGMPLLRVDSLSVPATAVVGGTITVTVSLMNGGQTDATEVTVAAPTVSGLGAVTLLSGPTPRTQTLAAGATGTVTFQYRPTTPGRVTFAATAQGLDALSGVAITSDPATSSPMDIDTPASLELLLSVPTQVTSGQSLSATLLVTNKGTAAARNVTPTPAFPALATVSGNASGTAQGSAPAALDIPGGGTATFSWTWTASGTGSLTASVGLSAVDGTTGQALTVPARTSSAIQVLAPSSLVVTGLTAPATVLRGQAFNVTLTVRNNGGVAANNVLPNPNPASFTATGSAGATSVTTPAAQNIASGATATFTFGFRESGTGTGSLQFSSGARGTDASTSAVVTANATQSNLVVVQAPAQLVVEAVTLPSVISRGQNFSAQVVIRNSGGSSATNVRPSISWTPTGSAAATVVTSPTAVSLSGGARTTFTYALRESGADAGTLKLNASASGTEATLGTALTSPAVSSSVLTVETAATLVVSTFVLPATLKSGSSFSVGLTVSNTGQADALDVLPSPSPPTLTATGAARANTASQTSPLTVPGGGSQTFTWFYSESGSGAGTLRFSTSVRGVDSNSSATVSSPVANSNTAQVLATCDPAQYTGITYDQVAQDFANTVYPLMTRSTGGCAACHAPGLGRPFVIAATGAETYQQARTSGFMTDGPGTILDRLSSSEPLLQMPRGGPAWTSVEIEAQAVIVCKTKAAALTTPPTVAQPPQFSCNAGAVPPELPLPRLSRAQSERVFRFAIQSALPAESTTVWNAVASAWERYPSDIVVPAPGDLRGGYSRTDQAIRQTQVDAAYDLSLAIAQQLTSTSARMGTLMGACATDTSTTNDRTCLEAFLGRWGSRLLRYPLSAADIKYYADMTGTTPVDRGAVSDVIAVLLNAPQVLYRVEHGTDATVATSPLSAYELASRLSLHLWQMPPDDALWAAAQDGSLLTPSGYETQLTRLVQSTNVRNSLNEFVAQWLRLEEIPALDTLKNDPRFKAFAGAQLPTSSARQAMISDVLSSAAAMVSSGGSFTDFLKDRHSYATDAYLAGIYQVAAWSGSGAAPEFPSALRSGLLTRAAMFATGTATTRPIHKGYVIRNALLCQQVGEPPPDVNTDPPPASATLTTRQVVTNITSSSTCAGCHAVKINPPGFLSEGFDSLGRERTHERLFDSQGNLLATLPVDTTAVPEVVSGDKRLMSDVVALTQAIDESKLAHSCLARHYFRFSVGRVESTTVDGCLLSELETTARSGAPLGELLKVVTRASGFKTRRFQ